MVPPPNLPLRVVNFHLSNTQPKQLPGIVPTLIRILPDCRNLLSAPGDSIKKDSNNAVNLHKFKTLLTTLLNDKSSEAKWAAVVLLKTTVDLGGQEIVRDAGKWLRACLSILSRPEPAALKKICIITISKIFILANGSPTLEREIAKPSLPPFVTTCLDLISTDNPASARRMQHVKMRKALFNAVFETIRLLLPIYPTTLRPFLNKLRKELARQLVGCDDSEDNAVWTLPPSSTAVAQSVWPLLNHCVPPTKQDEAWTTDLTALVDEIHATADHVFRSVVERWRSYCGIVIHRVSQADNIEYTKAGHLSVPPWRGIVAGCERLNQLLYLLCRFIRSSSSAALSLPVGRVFDLLMRMFQVTSPSSVSGRSSTSSLKFNDEISKDERESLFSELPTLHETALDVINALGERMQGAMLPLIPLFEDMIDYLFEQEGTNEGVRRALYVSLSALVRSSGSNMSKTEVRRFDKIIKACCNDLLPTNPHLERDSNGSNAKLLENVTSNKDSNLDKDTALVLLQREFDSDTGLHRAAGGLLTAYLSKIPAHHIHSGIRASIDRAIVMTSDHGGLLASVLNPPVASGAAKPHSSLLPMLVRACPEEFATEAILRPRLPPISQSSHMQVDLNEEDALEDVDHFHDHLSPQLDEPMTIEPSNTEEGGAGDAFSTSMAADHQMPLRNHGPKTTESFLESSSSRDSSAQVMPATKRSAPSDALPEYTKRGKLGTEENSFPAVTVPRSNNSNQDLVAASASENLAHVGKDSFRPSDMPFGDTSNKAGQNDDEDDDDSEDFEIPELNLEPDTDEDE